MANIWYSLQQRLRGVTNDAYLAARENDKPGQYALLSINLLKDNNNILLAWHRPEITILEPSDFDPFKTVQCMRVKNWSIVMAELHHTEEAALIIRRGEPVAWLT